MARLPRVASLPRPLIVIMWLLATLAAAGPAAAAVPVLRAPAEGAVVATTRPTFEWGHNGVVVGSAGRITTGYEVIVPGLGVVARMSRSGPSNNLFSLAAQVDLPDDTSLKWQVRALGTGTASETSGTRELRIATPATTAPAIVDGPAGPTNEPSPVFTWIAARGPSTWSLTAGGAPAPIATGAAPRGGGRAPLGPLADGEYTFQVVQTIGDDDDDDDDDRIITPPATRTFSVDTGRPATLRITAAPPLPTRDRNPAFAWVGAEPGARVTWQVIGAGGNAVRGPVDTAEAGARVGPLPSGSYIFQVRQSDLAGNAGEWRSEPFAVARRAGLAALADGPRLPTRNVRALRPKIGARVASTRPVLRWKARGGARLYNLQIFRVGAGGDLVKVRSVFPRSNRFRLSQRRDLARGGCYLWRVWPYLGTRFTKRPLGISNFCVAPRRAA